MSSSLDPALLSISTEGRITTGGTAMCVTMRFSGLQERGVRSGAGIPQHGPPNSFVKAVEQAQQRTDEERKEALRRRSASSAHARAPVVQVEQVHVLLQNRLEERQNPDRVEVLLGLAEVRPEGVVVLHGLVKLLEESLEEGWVLAVLVVDDLEEGAGALDGAWGAERGAWGGVGWSERNWVRNGGRELMGGGRGAV